MTGLRIFLGALILGGLGAAAPFTPLWLISLVTLAMSTGLVVCGLIILWRGGLVPFGQALFFATGAYTVALSGRWFGVTDAFLLIALAVIMAALVAFVVGFLLAQYREIFFAMLSLALSMILYGVLVKSETLGSTDGINVAPGELPRLSGRTVPATPSRCSGCPSAWCFRPGSAFRSYLGSVAGQLAGAIRDNEIRVEYLGISVTRLVHLKLTISAALAGAGGALAALSISHVDPQMAYWTTSGGFVFVTILAGAASVPAAFLGALLFEIVRTIAVASAARRLAIDPRIGAAADDPVRARGARLADDPQTRHRFRGGGDMSALLSVKGLEKTFGQVVAARDINVDVPQGQTVGHHRRQWRRQDDFRQHDHRPSDAVGRHHPIRGQGHHRVAVAQDHAAGYCAFVSGGAGFSDLQRVRKLVRGKRHRPFRQLRGRCGVVAFCLAETSAMPKPRLTSSRSPSSATRWRRRCPGRAQAARHCDGDGGQSARPAAR